MSKVITSPSKRWQGTVTIADPLLLSHAEAIEPSFELPEGVEPNQQVRLLVLDKHKLPAVFACVEKWELSDFPEEVTPETLPISPRAESHQLIDWIYGEIMNVYLGDTEVPNE